MTIPHRANQALKLHVDFINLEIADKGAPADLGELFDCEDETFHKFAILQDSANQYALGFIDAMALVKGVAVMLAIIATLPFLVAAILADVGGQSAPLHWYLARWNRVLEK